MVAFFGLNNQVPYSLSDGTTSAGGAIAYEEVSSGTSGSGVGFGQRLAGRDYGNYATEVFTGSGATATPTLFNGGRYIVHSVSNRYTMPSIIAGTYDTDFNNMFTRLLSADFGGVDTSGAGTRKPLELPFCLQHEVDVPSKKIDPAQYVSAWKHVRVLRNARATALGINPLRVPMLPIFTAYGVNVGRAQPYWPGNDQVDYLGIDSYSGLNGGSWTLPSANMAKSFTFNTNNGNKNILICETSVIEETGKSVGDWWANWAAVCAAHPEILGILAFQGRPGGDGVNFDKLGHPAKHEAMRQFILTTGATAGYGTSSSTQLKPSAPTGTVFVSASDGKSIVVSWSANDAGDNVTGWDVYIAPGVVSSGFTKANTVSPLPVSPRNFTITGLTPGAPYTVTVVAANAVGRSGFGTMFTASTTLPGPTNQSPVITNVTATNDASDGTLVHFVATATDTDPLTYSWTVAGAGGFTDTLTGAAPSKNYTPGAYQATVRVSDAQLTTTQTVPFAVAAGPNFTPNFRWEVPQPGINLREITRIVRQAMPDQDQKIYDARTAKSAHNVMHGLVASTFDPALCSTNKTSFVTNDFRWYKMILQSDTVTGIHLYLTDAQAGTGTSLCVHDFQGVQLCDLLSGTAVDTALQTTGTVNLSLPVPITGVEPGSVVYVGALLKATTPFKTYVAAGQSVLGTVNQATGYARGNGLTGQTSYPTVLPFASATAYTAAWLGLF